MEKIIAKQLLDIKAVFLRPEEPFTWASGIKSPIYCDNRLILSAPQAREIVEKAIADTTVFRLDVRSEEERRNECEDDHDHGTLGIVAVVDLRADALSGGVRGEQEGSKTVEHRPESVEFSALFERGAYFFY